MPTPEAIAYHKLVNGLLRVLVMDTDGFVDTFVDEAYDAGLERGDSEDLVNLVRAAGTRLKHQLDDYERVICGRLDTLELTDEHD